MRYTLLEMVQEILSSLDSDNVSTITDTDEAYQIALLLRGVYYDLATELELDEHEGLFELDASGDNTKPNLMTVPSNVIRLDWIKYDNKETGDTYSNWQDVSFAPFNTFLEYQAALRTKSSNVGELEVTNNSETFTIMYRTNQMPLYYTTMDDYNLIFDGYDSTEDTTLQASKTMCYGSVYPTFTLSDSFEPDLEPQQFSYFRNRAKVRAFAELKQAQNADAAYETKRQKIAIQKKRRLVEDYPEIFKIQSRFGRNSVGFGSPRKIPRFLRNGG